MIDRLTSSLVFLSCVTLVSGCTSEQEQTPNAVPRPVAYPRLDLPQADSMVMVDESFPVPLAVNPAATLSLSAPTDGNPIGVTADYPISMGATVYYTLIPVNDDDERVRVLEARQRRISLNLNGAPAETSHASSGDNTAIIVTATTGSQTPVQLLAEIGDRWVLSATAFVHDGVATNRYDSISPLYDYLRRDLERALPNLNFQPGR